MGTVLIWVLIAGGIGVWIWSSMTPSGKAFHQAQVTRRQAVTDRQAKIVCPYCQTPGHVTVRAERRAKRKTATRILGAAVTMGGSLPVTGVSKKGTVTVLSCSNCGMSWDAPKSQP